MGVLDKLKKTLKGKEKQNTSKKSLGTKQKGSSANKRDKKKTPNDEQSFRRQLLNEQKKKKQKTESVQKQFGEKSYAAKYGGNKPSYSTMKSSVEKKKSSNTVGTVKKPTPAGTDPKEEKLKAVPSLTERAQNRKKLIDEYNTRTNDRYNIEKNGLKARQAVKSGEYQSDPEVAKFDVDKHPIASSAARGAVSGASFGLSELLAAKAPMSEKNRAAEEYYQENKNPLAETAAELGTSFLGFGLTGEASAKAAGAVAKKIAPNALEKASARITARAMETSLLRKAAEKEALMRFGTNGVTEEIIQQIMKRRAAQITAEVGKNLAQDLTSGAMMDISQSATQSDNWGEFGNEMLKNIGINAGLNAATSLVPAFRVGRGAAEDGLRSSKQVLNGMAESAGKRLDNNTERVNIRDMAKASQPSSADDELARVTAETERLKAETEKLRSTPKTETPKAETPKTDVVPKEATTKDGKRGERTEFKRNDAETAKEKAKNKRTTKNQKTATKESFDKDFAAFEKKASENQAKVDELKSKLRSASTDEEKVALKKQIDELNSEVSKAYKQASLRYHPDRGGSDEWMGKFNNAYSDYKHGSYKSRAFKGAESSTRAKTKASAGGGGNTPPPRRTANGNEGFKKPQGKAKKSRVVNDVEDVVFKKKAKTSMRDSIAEAGKAARTWFVDSLSAFEDEARKNLKTDPDRFSKDKGAIDKLRRHGAQATNSIENHQIKWNGERFENGKSLKDIYKGMDEETEKAFDAYLLLRHAPDRLREGKPIFDDIEKLVGKVGNLNDPEVLKREAEKRLKEHPEFAQLAEEVNRYTRNELQNRVDAGLLSQEVADDWLKKYPNYVPTQRDGFFNAVNGNSNRVVGAGELKAAKGSDYDIRSIREQLEDATRRNWRDMSMNNLFRRMFGDRVANEIAGEIDGGFEAVLDNTINLSKSKESGKYFAIIFNDGKAQRVEIEKRFYDAIEDLYKNGRFGNGLDAANDALSKAATVWKNLITSWSPIFMVKNFMRDFPEAIINTHQTKEFLACMGPALKDLVTGGPYSQALKDAGISQSTFIDLDKAIKKAEKKLNPLEKLMAKVETANELTEMYPRLIEYMATFKKAGVDFKNADMALRDAAAANAADVTVNFGRSGSVGKMLNRGYVPFFNASMQGWSKFARNISELSGTKETLSFVVKAASLGAGATLINNYLNEDNPNYQVISARDKATNYIIPLQSSGDEPTNMFIKIPKSRFASVYGIPAVNLLNENKMGWAEAIKIINDQIAPISPSESHFGAALVQAKNNKTWYGTPIVSESIENKTNPSQEYDANTSEIGKALGKATEKLPTELQISPKKADYVIDATTGVVGDFALPMATKSRQSGGTGVGKYLAPAANVAKRQFTIDSVTQNDLSTRFYDKLQKASDNSKLEKSGQKEADEYKRLNNYSTEVSNLNKAIKFLQGSNRKTKQEDIYELQKVRNQLMQNAIDGKDVPSSSKTMDAVQKNVGTTYAIDNFGSATDKEAMKVYGASKYGDLSAKEMAKKIDGDKPFYKGVKTIGKLEDKLAKAGIDGNTTTLTRAVALASINADKDIFGAYQATKKSRTESANKMDRANKYFKDGGSTDEYTKLEKTRKTVGKLSDYDKDAELAKALKQLKSGKISEAEYYKKQGEIKYNANISYLGLATSLAQANSPKRGYELYDIKPKNIQKGINLAAMGFNARDYRKMAKAVDTDGNGYPSKAEITAYVSKSGVKDKATLFDALYYYKGSHNPFGTPTNYTREQAAKAGKKAGIEAIDGDTSSFEIKDDSSSSGSGYGYRRWRRWHSWGHGGRSRRMTGLTVKNKTIKKDIPHSKTYQHTTKSSKAKLPTVKFKEGNSTGPSIRTALEDIQRTEKKVSPPKARR